MAADLAVSLDGGAAFQQVHAFEHGVLSKFILNGEGNALQPAFFFFGKLPGLLFLLHRLIIREHVQLLGLILRDFCLRDQIAGRDVYTADQHVLVNHMIIYVQDNRTVFEGSYVGASSFSSWEDGTGNNRRMLEVRNAAYQASLDFAVLLRTCSGGTWASYRLFHAGMATPIPLANGGTGASSAKAALSNLGIFYSASLPSSGTDGQICLVPV